MQKELLREKELRAGVSFESATVLIDIGSHADCRVFPAFGSVRGNSGRTLGAG
jgi:hypothetical protein